jgi:DNA-binding IclR family transcriptional regulator
VIEMADVVKSAGRIFDVLEYFEEAKTPLGLKAICDRFGWPPSSAFGILRSLVMRGYLDYDRFSLTYMPTMRVAILGHWVSDALFGDGNLLAFMEELQALTGETVSVGTQSDLYAQHVHVMLSAAPPQASIRSGSLRPLARSGLGVLLLSARSDDTIDLLLRRINIEERDRTSRVRFDDVLERVDEVRQQGYVYARNTIVPGATLVGKLLPGLRQGRLMAVNVIGPSERMAACRDLVVRSLHDGISRLSLAVGNSVPA